ncbi:hypothetical protein [Rhodopila sp.]|uniref:hypothetical protein n=1 Tax=Rhodopila sp. TaxID=2480087 RepID=UPI003D0C3CFE
MRRMRWAILLAAALRAAPVHAFDPAGVDIIGLRLGMQAPEVIACLGRQGYKPNLTPTVITANTMDGRLQVILSAERGVTEVRYVFRGHGAGELALIPESVRARFGDPDQTKPPTWCRAVSSDGTCPGAEPSLTFLPESLTLILRGQADSGQ